ncbi:MAG TPA: hypothetical protein VFF72_08360 [Caldimonas sp.]|nr:hypothetical protein [Caldimonas sp.]
MAEVDVYALAKAMNLTPRRVYQLRHEGLPAVKPGRYDLGRCLWWYIRYLQAAVERQNGTPNGGLSLTAERARLAREQANRLALQNEERRAATYPAELVHRTLLEQREEFARLLDKHVNEDDALVEWLRTQTDPGRVRQELQVRIRAVRSDMADFIRKQTRATCEEPNNFALPGARGEPSRPSRKRSRKA